MGVFRGKIIKFWHFRRQIRHQLFVSRDKRDNSAVWEGCVTRDWRIEWNCTVCSDFCQASPSRYGTTHCVRPPHQAWTQNLTYNVRTKSGISPFFFPKFVRTFIWVYQGVVVGDNVDWCWRAVNATWHVLWQPGPRDSDIIWLIITVAHREKLNCLQPETDSAST